MSASAVVQRVVSAMNTIAPLAMADRSWDNVGLLLEHPRPNPDKKTVFLTIDLTEKVLDECINEHPNCGMIVAYHPPIFASMKRLTMADTKQRIVLRALDAGLSIYSPHTSLDACDGGINDWLADIIGSGLKVPIQAVDENGKPPSPRNSRGVTTGYGRVLTLQQPICIKDLAAKLKIGLGVPTLRVAVPEQYDESKPLTTFAMCAGSGISVLRQCSKPVDVWLTGEMSHHDVLSATAKGTVVILAEHTNTERGFIKARLEPKLAAELRGDGYTVVTSTKDADPLVVW